MPVSAWRLALRSSLFRFGLAFGAFSLLFLGIALQTAWREARFEHNARPIEAAIVAKDIERADLEKNTSTKYLLRYRFTPPGGTAAAEGTEEVSVETWEAAAPGAALDVQYLPADPASNRAAGTGGWIDAIVWSMLGLVFGGIGSGLLISRIRRIGLVLRLMRSGAAAAGEVIAVFPTGYRVNRVPQWRISYAFTDASGRRREGVSDAMPPEKARRWSAGEKGTVRYDAEAPEKSLWIDEKAHEVELA